MKKIGIMGGTFDPIHNGHLSIGKQAYLEYHLDEVWFMPSGHPPHKKDHFVTDAVHRCAMTKLAITDYPYFQFSDFEVKRAGNTYTFSLSVQIPCLKSRTGSTRKKSCNKPFSWLQEESTQKLPGQWQNK